MNPSLSAYIPLDRRLVLRGQHTLAYETSGAALFADISGFTPLTVALLDELGPKQGAEELTRQLNRVYDQLVTCVYAQRGAVITFAGDAITCWFENDNGLAATTAGLAMQTAMQAFAHLETPGGTAVSLAIKIAIATGPARRFVVGDPTIQRLDALVGTTLDEMSHVEKLAEKGDVLLAPSTAAALGEAITISAWRGTPEDRAAAVSTVRHASASEVEPWPPFAETLLPADVAQSWLLPPIYDRLQVGQADFLAEIRPATILFLQFTGLDLQDDPAVDAKTDQYVRWVQQTLARYDGYLLQLMFGDKGCVLYAAFGAPVANEDNMVRAVAAARELQNRPAELAFITSTKIGISQGRVYAGAYGGQQRGTYGVLGSEANIAARFMGQAEAGQILVRDTVAEAVGQLFRAKYLGQIYVKGVSRPVGMHLITERIASPTLNPSDLFPTPLVGRESELAEVEALFTAVQAGYGRVLEITGGPGLGKSHFAAELLERALGLGFRAVVGYGQAINRETAYTPWRQIFRTLLGLSEEAGMGEMTRSALARQMSLVQMQLTFLNPEWVLRLPLMGDVLGLAFPDTAVTQPLTPKQRQESLFNLLLDMLALWAEEQPLLLLLEDVQQFDSASLSLLTQVAQRAAAWPLALVLVRRPAPQAEEASVLDVSGLPHTAVTLSELSWENVSRMMRNQLRGEVTPLLVDVVQYQAQGNPFFVGELVDLLRESELVVQDERERWGLNTAVVQALHQSACLDNSQADPRLRPEAHLPELTIQLPDSVYASVLTRFDRLPETHKLTLKVASVIGRTFELGLVHRIHPLDPEQEGLYSQTRELVVREFVRQQVESEALDPPPDEDDFAFKHNIIHEVTYDTLLAEQRRQLHTHIAEQIAIQNAKATPLIAYHAYKGQDWARGLEYHLLAGQQARQVYANLEAITYLLRANECAERLTAEQGTDTRPWQMTAHLLLGQTMLDMGRYEPATHHLETALGFATALDDVAGQAQACRWLGRRWELEANYEAALDWLERGLAVLGPEQVTADAAEMHITMGLIHSRRGDIEAGLVRVDTAVAMAQTLADRNVQARAYTLRGHLARLRGQHDEALAHFQTSLEQYEAAGNVQGAGIVHNQMANAYFGLSRWPEAYVHYEQARQMFGRMGDVYNQAFAENNLAQLLLYRGEGEAARDLFQHVLTTFQQAGQSLYVLGVIAMNLGATHTVLQELDTARGYLAQARELYEQAQVRDFLPELARHEARLALAEGALDTAEKHAHTAVALAETLDNAHERGIALRVLGQVQLAQQNHTAVQATLAESIAVLSEMDDAYELALAQAALAQALGGTAEGQALAAQSEATLARLGLG